MTLALFAYFLVASDVPLSEKRVDEDMGLEEQIRNMAVHQDFLAHFGTIIYVAVFANCVLAFLKKPFLGTTWEKLSICIGLFTLKACTLVTNKIGPAVYFCMLLQLYHFSRILNRRFESRPGASFTLQMLFCYFTTMQYFYRSNHR